jgi:hypothetical protein
MAGSAADRLDAIARCARRSEKKKVSAQWADTFDKAQAEEMSEDWGA